MTRGGYQPYSQQGGRLRGPTLDAMLRGAPSYLGNPMDISRRQQTGSLLALLLARR